MFKEKKQSKNKTSPQPNLTQGSRGLVKSFATEVGLLIRNILPLRIFYFLLYYFFLFCFTILYSFESTLIYFRISKTMPSVETASTVVDEKHDKSTTGQSPVFGASGRKIIYDKDGKPYVSCL